MVPDYLWGTVRNLFYLHSKGKGALHTVPSLERAKYFKTTFFSLLRTQLLPYLFIICFRRNFFYWFIRREKNPAFWTLCQKAGFSLLKIQINSMNNKDLYSSESGCLVILWFSNTPLKRINRYNHCRYYLLGIN